MPAVIAEAIDVAPPLVESVQKASRVLAEVLGPSNESVQRRWKEVRDGRGRALVELTLSDGTGSVVGVFTPDELADELELQRRLYRLWGDLLQIRSHKQLDKVRQMVRDLED
jgi:hypothetical protein